MTVLAILRLIGLILIAIQLVTLLVFAVTWNFGKELEAIPYLLIGNAALMVILSIVLIITKIIQAIVGY